MIVNIKDILIDARKNNYGVGAFNVSDYSTVEAVCLAAEKTGCPVMIQIGDWIAPNAAETVMGAMSMFDYKNLMSFIKYRAEVSPIPIGIHLDHCNTYEGCLRGIQHGATSVMIDVSMESFEDNIALTKKVVEACKELDVSVEAEIGHVGGHFGTTEGAAYTTPESAKEFFAQTGVDFLAVAIGTVHGEYTSEPQLQYDLIAELRDAIPSPLVMHGGSGLSPEQYGRCVENGITKINFATYAWREAARAAKEVGNADGDKAIYPAMNGAAIQAMADYLAKHIEYFKTKSVK